MYRLLLLVGVILAILLCIYLGWAWYVPALIAALLALVLPVWRRGGFWFSFLAGFFTWGIYSGFLNWENQGLLSDRLAETFSLPDGWLLVLVTAVLGAFTTGFGGWFGASLRLAFTDKGGKAKA